MCPRNVQGFPWLLPVIVAVIVTTCVAVVAVAAVAAVVAVDSGTMIAFVESGTMIAFVDSGTMIVIAGLCLVVFVSIGWGTLLFVLLLLCVHDLALVVKVRAQCRFLLKSIQMCVICMLWSWWWFSGCTKRSGVTGDEDNSLDLSRVRDAIVDDVGRSLVIQDEASASASGASSWRPSSPPASSSDTPINTSLAADWQQQSRISFVHNT